MVFPITTTPPSYYTQLRAKARHGNVFYTNESGRFIDCLTFGSTAGAFVTQPFTGSYVIRDYYGNITTTGTLTAATTVPIPDGLPCGGYSLYLTQGTNDATYGFSAGTGRFIVITADARFPSFVGVAAMNSAKRGALGDDCYMHGLTMQGPRRDGESDPTNTGYTSNIHTGLTLDASWYANPAYLDPNRPARLQFVENVNLVTTQAQIDALSGMVADFYDNYGMSWWEGPANEPSGNAATIAGQLQSFSGYVKATRPSAKVMGPDPVTFNNTMNQPGTGYLHNVLANMAAMNPVPIDAISVHGYNCLNGDLSLGRLCYGQLRDTIASVGLQNLPLWHTEQGYWAAEHGAFMPRLQGRWTMLMFLLEEQYGIPKERHVIFTDAQTSDYTFPSFYSSDGYFPAVAMLRAYSAEVWGKTFTSAFDFGTPGNDMLLGSLYTSPSDGSQMVALQAAGSTDLSVKLTVSAGSSVTVADCFGNTSTVAVTTGVATIPVALEPVYVRIPAGVTVGVSHQWNATAVGTDLATSGTASASGTTANVTANAARMINGQQQSTYYQGQVITASNALAPYVDDTNAFPAWARVDWATAQTLDVVNVFAAPPWQSGGTLLDFDVQWLDADGVTWHTERTITEKAKYGTAADATANVMPNVAHQNQGGCTVESFFSDRWIFPVKFAAKVTTKAIRIYVRAATYGMDATIEAQTAKGNADKATYGNNFTIRTIQAFNSAAAAPAPAAGPRFLLRANALS